MPLSALDAVTYQLVAMWVPANHQAVHMYILCFRDCTTAGGSSKGAWGGGGERYCRGAHPGPTPQLGLAGPWGQAQLWGGGQHYPP